MDYMKSFFIWLARFTIFFAVIGIFANFVVWAINTMGLSELGAIAFVLTILVVGGSMVAAYLE